MKKTCVLSIKQGINNRCYQELENITQIKNSNQKEVLVLKLQTVTNEHRKKKNNNNQILSRLISRGIILSMQSTYIILNILYIL